MNLPISIGGFSGAFLIAFPALFSIINPLGSALIFYKLTEACSHLERRAMALRISAYSLLVLIGSLILGSYVLTFFGVSIGALRVGGGLVVVHQAWSLLNAPPVEATQSFDPPAPHPEVGGSVFFPLTTPLTIGPGSISVAIALGSQRPSHDQVLGFFAGTGLAALANTFVIFLSYSAADHVLKAIGASGTRVVTQVSAFLLLCIGVQIISVGAGDLITLWQHRLQAS